APSLPRGLVGSHWLLTPGGRRHWPFQSGYFDSSCACALASEKTIAAPRSEPKLQRDSITFSPRNIILTLNPIVVVIAGLTRQSIPLPYLPPLAGGRQGRGWPHGQAGGESLRGDTGMGKSLHRPARLLSRLGKIFQVGRSLILLGRHQEAVGAQHVGFVGNDHMGVIFGAHRLAPHRPLVRLVHVLLHGRPWPGQRMVTYGGLVRARVLVGLVEVDALVDDGLVVGVERQAGRVVGARAGKTAGLHHQHVVAAIAVLIDPLPDGIAGETRLDLLGPFAVISKNSARVVNVIHKNMGRPRRDDDLERLVGIHYPRHAGGNAGEGGIGALSA